MTGAAYWGRNGVSQFHSLLSMGLLLLTCQFSVLCFVDHCIFFCFSSRRHCIVCTYLKYGIWLHSWDELLFFICPAVVAILDFRWTKTKLFKRVKYVIFLQNNMFIPRVVSDKILKLQHQKELVVEAMLNFWIKWKTCNVGNHPCNISTMLGLWLVKISFKCLWTKMNAKWWQ